MDKPVNPLHAYPAGKPEFYQPFVTLQCQECDKDILACSEARYVPNRGMYHVHCAEKFD